MKRRQCPECKGKKKVSGTCVCNMEWRGSKTADGFEDCQCEPERVCPLCGGTGFVGGN